MAPIKVRAYSYTCSHAYPIPHSHPAIPTPPFTQAIAIDTMLPMQNDFDKYLATLRDIDAGWVYRRDAADFLGKLIERAAAALRAVEHDNDVDVRTAIERALGHASAALAGVKPVVDTTYPLDELVKACARPGRREVDRDGNEFTVTAHMKEGRSQRVHLKEIIRQDGAKLIQILTYCGEVDDSTMPWALKMNTQLGRCALGISGRGDKDYFVLVNCIPVDEATPELVKAAVKEVAFYGDWIERKLTGGDTH